MMCSKHGSEICTIEGKYDFVSRLFSAREDVTEASVTGSTHSMLIPCWAEKLYKAKMPSHQGVERDRDLRCHCVGESVYIGGQNNVSTG